MGETPCFFRNGTYDLFGIVHSPEQVTASLFAGSLGVVFCHPFAEEKLIAHRTLVILARRFAGQGIHCFRFDEMGHGDSQGDFEEATIETRLSDIRRAVDFLVEQTDVERVCLFGVRLGATLALLASSGIERVKSAVLIAPIIEGKSYIDQCLRSNLTTQMTTYKKIIKDRTQLIADLKAGISVNIDGYLLSTELYRQMIEINLMATSSGAIENLLVLQMVKDEKQPMGRELQDFERQHTTNGTNTELMRIPGDSFWKDTKKYNPHQNALGDAAIAWLARICGTTQ